MWVPFVKSIRRACDGFAAFLNECKNLPLGFEHVVTAGFIVSTAHESDVPPAEWFTEMGERILELSKCGIYVQVHTIDFAGIVGPILSDLNALSLDPKRAMMTMTSGPQEVPIVMNALGVIMSTDTPTINVIIRPTPNDVDSIHCAVCMEPTQSGEIYLGRAVTSKRATRDFLQHLKDTFVQSEVYVPMNDDVIGRLSNSFGPPISSSATSFPMQVLAMKNFLWDAAMRASFEEGRRQVSEEGSVLSPVMVSTMKVWAYNHL